MDIKNYVKRNVLAFKTQVLDPVYATKDELANIPSGGGTGKDGKSAYEQAVEGGFTGTEAEWLESLKATNEYITPQMFGAKGDGTTDDTQAFHDAITTAKGKMIYIPSGIYRVHDCTIEDTAIHLVGVDNPTIYLNSGESNEYHGIFNFKYQNSIEISGITFKGERRELGETSEQHLLWFYEVSNVSIHDCVFKDVSREATTFFDVCNNIKIRNNLFDYTSCLAWFTKNVKVTNLLFDGNMAHNTRTHGIEFDTLTSNNISSNIVISNNHFDGVTGMAFILAQVKNVNVIGNFVTGSEVGIRLEENNNNLAESDVSVDNVVFSNNYFDVLTPLSVQARNWVSVKNVIIRDSTFNFRTGGFASNVEVDFINCNFNANNNITTATALLTVGKSSQITLSNVSIDVPPSYKGTLKQFFSVKNDARLVLDNVKASSLGTLYTLSDNASVSLDTDPTDIDFSDIEGV